ncbi:MAG TPA: winged helix DNA-binding domain-containing protein [Isosphaeraceae bacterium]|jgi:hypothetical protein|nr:winged helix DNA-binding domain-containing protein [Isosphaeraceae bacterium]
MKTEALSPRALNRALLARQMLLAREEISAVEAVERLVGLQAQQAQPPFIGLWTRIDGFEREDLLRPLRSREIVRSTLMRATLHLVSADDYVSLRGALQPALSAGMRAVLRDRAKALDVPAIVAAARLMFTERARTFTELRAALMDVYPDADERALGYAARMHLPLVLVPDNSEWGYPADADFADAESWLGRSPSVEERPETLCLRYLAAFGPATATDVQAWSAATGVREVLDKLRPKLRVFRDDRKRELFDLPKAPRPAEETPAPVRFLPGFDNVILSHSDRTRIIADEHRPLVTTRNLQVLPTFLVDGFVAGTWKYSRVKTSALLTVSPFAPLPVATERELAEEGQELARFIDPDAAKSVIRFEAP